MPGRQRPMSRGHARPQPPAASRRYGGGTEEPAPVTTSQLVRSVFQSIMGAYEGAFSAEPAADVVPGRARCRSGSPATEPSGPGAKLDPPGHTHPNPAPH
jgi:hypothetical protein